MKTVFKWVGRGVLAIAVLLLVVVGVSYAVSSQKMNRSYDVPLVEFTIPTDSMAIVEGERLARIRGCYNGCHGTEAEGELFVDSPLFGSIKSPDLTRAVATMSPAALERAIRGGVRSDEKGVVIMPSSSFYYLTEDDLGSMLAFLGSLPPSDGPETAVRLGPVARVLMAFGVFSPSAADIDHAAPRPGPGDGSDPIQLGRYLAMTSCTECHGLDLSGISGGGFEAPSLALAQAYSIDDFRRLLSEGIPIGVRELDLMALVAEKRFSHLTDDEVEAIHTLLIQEFGGVAVSVD
jgi:mono/diheme cytochrome c family protein